jgi:hypothetical protein
MPCRQVTVPGPDPSDAQSAQVSNISSSTGTNIATLSYTVDNPNDFSVEVEIKESITNVDAGNELDSNTVNLTIGANDSSDEQVQFGTNLGSGESINASLCADIQSTTNTKA